MSFYYVLKRFELLSGLEGDELSKWTSVCREAMEQVRDMVCISETELTDSHKLRLAYAAGALAFYKYCSFTSLNEPESFQAGEVRVKANPLRIQRAKALFEEELRGLSGVVRDSGFYFGRVKV